MDGGANGNEVGLSLRVLDRVPSCVSFSLVDHPPTPSHLTQKCRSYRFQSQNFLQSHLTNTLPRISPNSPVSETRGGRTYVFLIVVPLKLFPRPESI